MGNDGQAGSGVRLTELLAALSLGTDLGMGHPMEHVLRQSIIAMRLGERAGLGADERVAVFHSSMLAWVGCHVDAYEQAKWFGDDQVLKRDARYVDFGKPVESMAYLLRHLGAGKPLLQRAQVATTFLGDSLRAMEAMFENHSRTSDALAERLGSTTRCAAACSRASSAGTARATLMASRVKRWRSPPASSTWRTWSRCSTVQEGLPPLSP